MRRTLAELTGIASLVIVATLISQLFFPDRIPFLTKFTTIQSDSGLVKLPSVVVNQKIVTSSDSQQDPEASLVAENPAAITTTGTYTAFLEKKAIIIDARDRAEFARGHIQGAWNVPYTDLMRQIERFDPLPLDTLLITYCDGEECLASMDLANQLAAMGFTRVRYFFGGWNSWENNQYPIGTGRES